MSYKEIRDLSDRQKRRLKKQKLVEISNNSSRLLELNVSSTSSNNSLQVNNATSSSNIPLTESRHSNDALNSFTPVYQSSEFSSDEDDVQIPNAKEILREWAIENNITCNAINSLLPKLKQLGLDVPVDYRTLLKTPREVKIVNVSPGSYSHLGMREGIIKSINQYYDENDIPSLVKVNINVDGLPLTRSSGSQFWPILGAVVSEDKRHIEPFVIGLYHGFNKPDTSNDLLKMFVEETTILLREGINLKGKIVTVILNAFICDAPAKSFLTMTKGHTGYFSCTKCIQEGEYIQNKVTFPETKNSLRTDDTFRSKDDEDYHKGKSIIENLNVGMVSQFVLDYMHLVCLGVVKRIIQFWVKGNMEVRLKANEISNISHKLQIMRVNITSDFARQPRNLNDCDRWKATEFRQFLLYTGPVVLKSVLCPKRYAHFMSLSCAIRILASDLYLEWNDYAQSLLIYFVQKYAHFYGPQHITHNVHNLIHLATDARKFGKLHKFSAFKFENHLYKLKRMVRTSNKPLQQAVKRICEERDFECNVLHRNTTYQNRNLTTIQNYQFSRHHPNNCCLVQEEVILISNIYSRNDKLYIAGKKLKNSNHFFDTPCESKRVGIQIVNNNDFENVEFQSDDVLIKKCILFPHNNTESVVLTILH